MEITKDKSRPFYIETGHSIVHVTSTTINISCYPDEINSYITLVEGGVRMEQTDGKLLAVLQPQQQLMIDKTNNSFNV